MPSVVFKFDLPDDYEEYLKVQKAEANHNALNEIFEYLAAVDFRMLNDFSAGVIDDIYGIADKYEIDTLE